MITIQVFKNVCRYRSLCQTFRNLHFTYVCGEEQKRPKRKVRETTELITLLDSSDKVLGIKAKAESEKLAKKHHMLLEKVEVHKFGNNYPVYKLVSGADIVKRDQREKAASTSRDLKKISVSNRITDHDLEVKVKLIKRLLARNCEIHVAVTGSAGETSSMEGVYTKISEHLEKEARVLEKRFKESALKFIVIPPKVDKKQKDQTNCVL